MDILEQVGITKEELIERIVNKALDLTADQRQTGEDRWEDIPFSDVIDKKLDNVLNGVVERVTPAIAARIEELVLARVQAVFTEKFQPIDQWGKAKGEPTTIHDLIADMARDYWTERVDPRDGKPSESRYGTEKVTRAEFYTRQIMTSLYDKELVTEVKKMAEELRKRIPATIGTEVAETVMKHLK